MEHPFINNLGDKTLEEVQNTLSDLYKKLNFASRTGNSALIYQLRMAIESYQSQFSKKMDETFKKQKINTKIDVQGKQ